MKLFDRFFKKDLSEYSVDISIGKIYYKKITRKILDTAKVSATIRGDFNTEYFMVVIENELLDLSQKKLDQLYIKDADLIRNATKAMLTDLGIYSEEVVEEPEKAANIFSQQDQEWFNKSKNALLSRVGGQPNASTSNN